VRKRWRQTEQAPWAEGEGWALDRVGVHDTDAGQEVATGDTQVAMGEEQPPRHVVPMEVMKEVKQEKENSDYEDCHSSSRLPWT
jgi:hypothetical protein